MNKGGQDGGGPSDSGAWQQASVGELTYCH